MILLLLHRGFPCLFWNAYKGFHRNHLDYAESFLMMQGRQPILVQILPACHPKQQAVYPCVKLSFHCVFQRIALLIK